jgi:hypothetical protein
MNIFITNPLNCKISYDHLGHAIHLQDRYDKSSRGAGFEEFIGQGIKPYTHLPNLHYL